MRESAWKSPPQCRHLDDETEPATGRKKTSPGRQAEGQITSGGADGKKTGRRKKRWRSIRKKTPPKNTAKPWFSNRQIYVGFGTVLTYTLLNSEGRRYIGVSNDVDRRLAQHNQGLSTWTRGRGPWLLEWISTPRTLGEARKLENQLKRQKGGGGLDRILRTEGPAPKASGS